MLLLPLKGAAQGAAHGDIDAHAREEVRVLQEQKRLRTPAQRKLDSQLVYALEEKRHGAPAYGLRALRAALSLEPDGRLLVDIDAQVVPALRNFIAQNGGVVLHSFPRYHSLRALIPLELAQTLAERAEVRAVRPADRATTNAVDVEGDISHGADAARSFFGVNGAGVKIGVLSDSDYYLPFAQAAGDLPWVTVLPGQDGSGFGEGTAMLELVHALAPGAGLYFATAFNGIPSFAQNIRDLQAAGCRVIVDDVLYFRESPFQDGPIAQAVNDVSAAGVLFFSSAANSGGLNRNTSGTWEGDFLDGGPATLGRGGRLHDFGGTNYNVVMPGGSSLRIDFFWADPLGASTNDYDIYVLDVSNNVVRASTNIQDGHEDPYESLSVLNVGERIVVVKYSGEARYMYLSTGRGRLQFCTAGSTRGHNASGAPNAFSVAATRVSSPPTPFIGGATNPVEFFSSDGPRRVFFNPDGTPITPGNFSSTGGRVLQKPDITAADGVSTSVPGFGTFLGTSAAAPHAAAIACLLWSYNPFLTPDAVRFALTNTSLDIAELGFDRDSGAGIVMAYPALALVLPPLIQQVELNDANANNSLDANECADLVITLSNRTSEPLTGLSAVLTTSTPHVLADPAPHSFPDLAPGATATSATPFRISTGPMFACRTSPQFVLHLVSTNHGKFDFGQPFQLNSIVAGIGAASNFVSTNVPLDIPDLGLVESQVLVQGMDLPLARVRVSLHITHTYDQDLRLSLRSPDGTQVVLSANNGLFGEDYGTDCANPTVFSDDATNSIDLGFAPFLGSFIPDQPLAAFNGKSGDAVNGPWTLVAEDQAAGDTGTVQCWSLELSPIACFDGGGQCLVGPNIQALTDLVVTNGDTAQFDAVAEGTAPLSYQWYFNVTNALADQTNTTLLLSNVTPAMAGTYMVVVTNAYGSATSRLALLTVVVPPTIISGPTDQVVTNGGAVQWTVLAEGTEPLTYQWYFNDTNLLAEATQATLVLSNAGPANAGIYRVVVSNPYGSITSAPATLVVLVAPSLTCATNRSVTVGSAWDFDPPSVTGQEVVVNVLATVTNVQCGLGYQATRTWLATNATGFEATCSQTVEVVDTNTPVLLCAGDKVVAYGTNWTFDVPMARESGATEELVYDDLTNDLQQSFETGTVELGNQVTLGGSARYLSRLALLYWGTNSEQAGFAGTVAARVRFYLNDGQTNGVQVAPGTLFYDSGPRPIQAAVSATLLLEDFQSSATVPLAGAMPQSFTWTVQFSGLGSNDSVGLKLFGPPFVGQAEPGYWAEPEGSWQWQEGETNLFAVQLTALSQGLTLSVIDTVTNLDCGQGYTARRAWLATDACAHQATCTQTVQVVDYQGPVLVSQSATNQQVLEGQSVSLELSVFSCSPVSYQWYFNGTTLEQTNSMLVLSNVSPAEAGIYSVVATNAYGSLTSAPVSLVIIVLPSLTCGTNRAVDVGTAWDFDPPSVTGDGVVLSVLGTVTNVQCGLGYSATRSWLATNTSGFTATCSQTIQVVDTNTPVLLCAGDKVVSYGTNWSFDVPAARESGATEEIVYDNLTNAVGQVFNAGTLEIGNQVTLGGSARYISQVALPYWGSNSQQSGFSGIVSARVRFYLNDGATNVLVPGDTPGTLFYDSGPLLIQPSTNGTLLLKEFQLTAALPFTGALPDTFTWTVQFGGLGTNDAVGLSLFGPPVEGQSKPGYWAEDAGLWEWNATGRKGFGAQIIALSQGVTLSVAETVTNLDCGLGFTAQRAWQASDACGHQASCTQTVQVVDYQGPILVAEPPPDLRVEVSQYLSLDVTVSSCWPVSYQWYLNSTYPLADQTNSTLVLSNVSPSEAGSYTLIATNAYGSVTSAPVSVTVVVPAMVVNGPVDQVATNGESAQFDVLAQGTAPLAYQWYFNVTNSLPAQTNATLILTAVTPDNAGSYTVVVTNAYGSATSAPAALTVVVLPVIVSGPIDQVVTNGDTAQWSVLAQGTQPLSYQWYFNDTNTLAEATLPTFVLSNASPANAGTYRVVVSNPYGSVTSAPAALLVVVVPNLTCAPNRAVDVGTVWDFDQPTVFGDGMVLSVVGTVTNAQCGMGYQAIRTWTASDTNGFEATCSQTVSIVDTNTPVLLCAGDKILPYGTDWSFDAPSARESGTTEELVYDNLTNDLQQTFDAGMLEVGNEIILGGNSRYLSRLAFPYWGTNSEQAGFAGVVAARVRFYLNDGQTNGLAPAVSPGTLFYDSGPRPIVPGTNGTLLIEEFQLSAAVPLAGALPEMFTWTVQFSGLGSNDAAGLRLFAPPMLGQAQPGYWTQEDGNWQWHDGDTNLLGAQFTAVTQGVTLTVLESVTNMDCGLGFTARRAWQATDACAHQATCTQTVQVVDYQAPVLLSQSATNQQVLQGEPMSLEVSVSSCWPVGYQWYFNAAEVLAEQTNAMLVLTNVGPAQSGTYTVVITNAYGSITSAPATLVVLVAPSLTCATNRSVTVGSAWDFDPPTVTGQEVVANVLATVTNVQCGLGYQATRTWLATNATGFEATCSQTVEVVDTNTPVLLCAGDKVVAYGTNWTFDVPVARESGATEELVYDDLTNDLQQSFETGTVELGNQVMLGGSARYLSRLALLYWGTNSEQAGFAGAVAARVRFYLNDGQTNGVQVAPGTLFYDSGPRPIQAAVSATLLLEDFQSSATVPLAGAMPQSFSWTVQFSGLGSNDSVGLKLFGPPIVGQAEPGYWAQPEGSWQWQEGETNLFAVQLTALSQGLTLSVIDTVTNLDCGQGYTARRAWLATDACAHQATCTQTVQVVDYQGPVLVSQSATNQQVLEGQSVSLELSVLSCWPVSYQWYFNGTTLEQTNSMLVLSNVSPAEAGIYTVVATNAYGSLTSAPVNVSVVSPPAIVSGPSDLVVTNGDSAQFAVLAQGTEPLAYQWYFKGTNALADQTAATLSLTNVSPAAAGTYLVIVTNAYGAVTSPPALLIVHSPPQILVQPEDVTCLEGVTVFLTVEATGDAPLSYQWQLDCAKPIFGATTSAFKLKQVTPLDSGQYCVVISNAFGFVSSEPAFVRVLVKPSLLSLTLTNGVMTLRFSTVTNLLYSVDYSDQLNPEEWSPLPGASELLGTGLPITVQDTSPARAARFYRIMVR